MQKQTIMKMTAAVALLFAVNMNANAQFGKLKGLAKKAKEAVTEQVGDNPVSGVVEETSSAPGAPAGESNANQKRDRQWFKENSTAEAYEDFCVNEDGGMQQYLGMTEGDEALVWKYYDKYSQENYINPNPKNVEAGKTYGNELAQLLVSIKRLIKIADYKVDKTIALREMRLAHPDIPGFYYDRTYNAPVTGRTTIKARKDQLYEACLKDMGGIPKGYTLVPIKQEDLAAFKRVVEKYKAEYEAIYGPIPQP